MASRNKALGLSYRPHACELVKAHTLEPLTKLARVYWLAGVGRVWPRPRGRSHSYSAWTHTINSHTRNKSNQLIPLIQLLDHDMMVDATTGLKGGEDHEDNTELPVRLLGNACIIGHKCKRSAKRMFLRRDDQRYWWRKPRFNSGQ